MEKNVFLFLPNNQSNEPKREANLYIAGRWYIAYIFGGGSKLPLTAGHILTFSLWVIHKKMLLFISILDIFTFKNHFFSILIMTGHLVPKNKIIKHLSSLQFGKSATLIIGL